MPHHHHFEKENNFSLPVTPAAGSTPYMHPEALQHVSGIHGHYPGHRLSPPPRQPAFSMPPFASAPTHPSLADLTYRIGRLELENSQLRQVQAEQGAHLTILRDLVAKHPGPGAAPPIKVQATTESSLSVYLKYVKSDHSLLSDEQPGSDSLRRRADFPKVKYWTAQSWNQHEKKAKGSVRVGENIGQSGRARAATGENVSCQYIEDARGIAVDGFCVKRIRDFTYNFIAYMKKHKYAEPRWDDVEVSVRETFIEAIRRKWPEFQLCEANWKAHHMMAGCYYDKVTRPPRSKKEDQSAAAANVDLNDAKYILDDSDNSPLVSSGPPRTTSVVTAPSKREHPMHEGHAVVGPSKRPRLSIETTFVDFGLPSNSPPSNSPPSNSPPSNLPPSNSPPSNSPPSPTLEPTRATSVMPDSRRSRSLVPQDIKAAASASTVSPVLSDADSDAGAAVLPSAALTKGKQRAVPRKVHSVSLFSASSSTDSDAYTRSAQTISSAMTAMSKPKAKLRETSRKPWPPPASEVQNKWVYGRDEWLPCHPNGTLAEFEHHYTHELTESQRRKLAWEYKKIAARAASSAAG
ncbi:hypothetical protein BN946_scf184693.g13 [Trametes cinnabarina]|uniref:Uncharacterized protein n=1 Tax=Pycnoporus cinnabarinus TaxID=5643 RepID=A0A060ST96_PYCCI|nr:hypothetical protein BN946_scf184693.g13 [Trametes cinnabarina]